MCVCMDILSKPQQVKGIKGMIQYVVMGWLLAPDDDFNDGRSAHRCSGASGRLPLAV